MKKQIGLLLAALCVSPLMEKPAAVHAADMVPMAAPACDSLTLFETTELLDEQRAEVGLLAPQQVCIRQISSVRVGHGEGRLVPMYSIATWLGDKWIIPGNALRGGEEQLETYMELSREETVYEDPGLLTEKGKIGPQTVRVLSRWDGRYKIATPDGERWLAPIGLTAVGIRPIDAEVQLNALTKLYSFPHEYDLGASVSPQLMRVTAVWRDWYRADSWLGPVWFRLHELDAADAGNNIEVGLGYRYFDGTQTRIQAQVQLGPQWREQSEPTSAGFSVAFYDDNGNRVGVSSGATVRLTGAEPAAVDLTVDGNIVPFALATVGLGMFNGRLVNRINPGDSMAVADEANADLRVGAVRVRQEGAFSIVTGQFAYKVAGAHRLSAELSFLDADGAAIARVPLRLETDEAFPGSGALRAFEAVVLADVTAYKSLSLKVLEAGKLDEQQENEERGLSG